MSEFTWYSRLAVLAGVFVLVLQSFTARAVGLLTFVAVVAVFVGLLAFIAGLVSDARRGPITGAFSPADVADSPSLPRDELESRTEPDGATEVPDQVPAAENESAPHVQPVSGPVHTFRIDEALTELLPACPACGLPLGVGQIAARCGICETAYHASCWIDQDFSCAVEGCIGAGSLLAPSDMPATSHDVAHGPRGGPSKP